MKDPDPKHPSAAGAKNPSEPLKPTARRWAFGGRGRGAGGVGLWLLLCCLVPPLMGASGCEGEDLDGDGYTVEGGDCDDTSAEVYPGAQEVCGTGEDRDCDGRVEFPDPEGTATYYPDGDGDGYGDASGGASSCQAPAGYVERPGDNCPETYNAYQSDADGDGVGDACDCDDAVELSSASRWTASSEGDYSTELEWVSPAEGSPYGEAHLLAQTNAAFDWWLSYEVPDSADLRDSTHLRFSVRGTNPGEYGWQGNMPGVVLRDTLGGALMLIPSAQHLSTDGNTWVNLEVPFEAGDGWQRSGSVDLGEVHRIEIHADTWDEGFTFEIDGLTFESEGEDCLPGCTPACGDHSSCQEEVGTCLCDLGYAGEDCATCAEGYVNTSGACLLETDGQETIWPNGASSVNGDAWLVAHSQSIERMEPKVLVVNFVNVASPSTIESKVVEIADAFTLASRARYFESPGAEPALTYRLARELVDLRDGIDGRPQPPADYPYENSTLYPRRDADEVGYWRFDYAQLFNETFADYYGFADPQNPARNLTLCELVESGEINALWVVGSGDVEDVNAAEVLESKQRYTAVGNPIPGAFERCAGNGCFDADVPQCARTLRIGWINYNRGGGCYLHSHGHGLEGTATSNAVPALTRWFTPFARFDQDTHNDLPVSNLYGVSCSAPPCIQFPAKDSVEINHLGEVYSVSPYDGVCGNVHFPPNGQSHYDYYNEGSVLSSCDSFGYSGNPGGGLVTEVGTLDWDSNPVEDCGGDFLAWWFQHMPSYGTGQTHADGDPMQPVWPASFY